MNLISRDIQFTMLGPHDRLQTLRLDRLRREWQQAASYETPPDTSFIDPLRLGYLFGALIIFDVEYPPEARARYRYRMIGAEITERRGVDRTGDYIDQHPEPTFAEAAGRVCDLVLEACAPVHGVMKRVIDGRDYPVEILVLPLGDSRGTITQLLAAELYPADAPRRAAPARLQHG